MKTGKVSPIDFFCIGFGAIVGVGWAVSINSWMAGSGGPLPSALGYILALVIMIPIALCYCELCAMLPVSGGGMAYAFRAFGDRPAFVSGWMAFGAFITVLPWEAIYVVDILGIVFPAIKSGEPLYTLAGADVYPGHIIVGTIIAFVLYFINRRGVSSSASLQRILTFVLVGAGILAMICSLFKFDIGNYYPIYENIGTGTHKSFMGGAFAILASVPFFLAGFETIPQGVESAGGDLKSVGKTVVLTVVLSCIFYALLLVTLGGALPWKEFAAYDSPAAAILFKNIYPGTLGTALYLFILIGAISGLITTWNGFMMASSQILMAMARVSIVPDILAKQDKKYNTPTNALKVSLVASLVGPLLGSGLISSLTTFSAAGYVASWTITAFCLIKLRRTEPDLERPYKIPGGTKTAWFAGITMSILLALILIPGQPVFIGPVATGLFGCWMLIGVVFYALDYKQRKKYSQLKRASILFASMIASKGELPGFSNIMEESYKIISFVVPELTDYAGNTLYEIGWGKSQSLFVIKIDRGRENILLPSSQTSIYEGDRIFAMGLENSILDFCSKWDIGEKYTIQPLSDFIGLGKTERQAPIKCREIEVTEEKPYCGMTLRDAGIKMFDDTIVICIEHEGERVLMPNAETLISDGDTIWLIERHN